MSYAAAQHALTSIIEALVMTPFLVAAIKISLAVLFSKKASPAVVAAATTIADESAPTWDDIWTEADRLAPAEAPVDYGAIVADLVAESEAIGLTDVCAVAKTCIAGTRALGDADTAELWQAEWATSLMGHTKADLLATATRMGLSVKKSLTKAAIVAEIVAAPVC